MARFRTRPNEIEAEQWHTGKAMPGVTAATRVLPAYVTTATGLRVVVNEGEWVIAGPAGSGYCTMPPDLFAATFEPAGPDS